MCQNRVTIHRRVLPGLDVLTPAETEHLAQVMEMLETFSPEQPLAPTIKLIDPSDSTDTIQIDPGLMAIFGITEQDGIEIQDLLDPQRFVLNDWKQLQGRFADEDLDEIQPRSNPFSNSTRCKQTSASNPSIPFWQSATPPERVQDLRAWVSQLPKTGVSLSDEALSRDSIYEE